MRLQRHQYVLIILILALGAFNLVRRHRLHRQTALATRPIVRGTSPAWPFFDTAASLRDAPDAQFQPALKALTQSIDGTNAIAIPPQTSKDELTDLHGCQTWLLFYRQDYLHPSNKPDWRAQMQRHVESCAANHRDIAQ
ncbi:MAG: hypothetical protein M3R43_05495 [Acidobacteriota bacterium]|nr:hypothetical protein [Acidobacteriota bacterium]